MTLRVVSFGGGVQSAALLVLAAEGKIDYRTFLFANVGDNAENPATLDYVRDVAHPFAAQRGIDLVEVRREYRDKRDWTLYDALIQSERSIGIPVRLEGSGAPARRNCTSQFKIEVIARWLREHGATAEQTAIVGLGISTDEFQRMRTSSGYDYYNLDYPLFRLKLDRSNCAGIIHRAGLPVPPKSSCFFCPYHRLADWREMKRDSPELFARAVHLERVLSERGEMIGTGKVYMTRQMVPLDAAVGDGVQPSLFEEDDACESGFCMT